jgi:hypothetical protein
MNFGDAVRLTNENEGFISILLFLASVAVAWAAGVFRYFRQRPKFTIEAMDSPVTLCSSFDTDRVYEGERTHRTAIALYLKITNIGNAASAIGKIEVGYRPIGSKNPFRWIWIKEETASLEDFTENLAGYTKIYPFLKQGNHLMNNPTDGYLRVGDSINGIAYFEGPEALGPIIPDTRPDNSVAIKITIADAFGRQHTHVTRIAKVRIDGARERWPHFGRSRESVESSITVSKRTS